MSRRARQRNRRLSHSVNGRTKGRMWTSMFGQTPSRTTRRRILRRRGGLS